MTAIDRDEMNRRLIEFAEGPDIRVWRLEFETLSQAERVFLAVWELEAEVNNGGFDQYFQNYSGRLAPFAADALRAIGATTMAGIVQEAVEMIGAGVAWDDDGARQARIEALTPEATDRLESLGQSFLAYPDDQTTLLYRYVCEHRSEVGAPGKLLRTR